MSYYILFTGHMIDAADRKTPRFPTFKELSARAAIRHCLVIEAEKHSGKMIGIAGAASGGDILFHELCSELGIRSEIYLALPEHKFKQESVSYVGNFWVKRFDKLIKTHRVHILPEDIDHSTSVWIRANLWMLQTALKEGGDNMLLLALWDGKGGDGEGGTEQMVNLAKEKGSITIIIDIKKI